MFRCIIRRNAVLNNFSSRRSNIQFIKSPLLKNFLTPEKVIFWFSTTVKNEKKKTENSAIQISEMEQVKILEVLNNKSNDSLTKLNIPSTHVNKLNMWRTKRGPFTSINDVLEIEGINVENLLQICQSIILDKPISSNRKSNSLKHRQLSSPILTNDAVESLSSIVGLHLGPAGISWAHITCPKQTLINWGTESFTDIPVKVSSWENFNLAAQVLDKIPSADLYVFETSISSQNQPGAIVSYMQHVELNSMLFALLNTSKNHNKRIGDKISQIENVVYYLRAKLTARFFKTWVGNETVSCITTVRQLFNYNQQDLPCSEIDINQKWVEMFEKETPFNKEVLGQALLMTMTFLDLCVKKNARSLQQLSSRGKKN